MNAVEGMSMASGVLHFKTILANPLGTDLRETIGFNWNVEYDGRNFTCLCSAVRTDQNGELYNAYKRIILAMQNAYNIVLSRFPVNALMESSEVTRRIKNELLVEYHNWDDARRKASASEGPSGGKSFKKRRRKTRRTRRTRKTKKTRKTRRR